MIQDLSEIDFSKCELPDWDGAKAHVEVVCNSLEVCTGIYKHAIRDAMGRWSAWGVLLSDCGKLETICRIVDRFIESELAKQDEPKWRPCSKEFALANPRESMAANMCLDGSWSDWEPVGRWSYFGLDSEYMFKTKAKEPLDAPDTANPIRASKAFAKAESPDLATQLKRLRRRVRKLEKRGEK